VWADALANRSLPDTVVPRKRDAAFSANSGSRERQPSSNRRRAFFMLQSNDSSPPQSTAVASRAPTPGP